MTRRELLARFLGTAAGAAAAASGVLDLDLLAWTPGEKTIVLPPAPAIVPVPLDWTLGANWDTFYDLQVKDIPESWKPHIRAAAQALADDIDRRAMLLAYNFEQVRRTVSFRHDADAGLLVPVMPFGRMRA